jgi:deazaflavin-dependent oxidoreductase (nitroreductase family)
MTPAEVLGDHSADECCDVTTTGRRSGNPHRVEIWFGMIGETMYLISGNGDTADWYRNAVANPRVIVEVGGHTFGARARAVTDADERRRVGEVMCGKYRWDGDESIGLTRAAWCYDVPALAIAGWE